MIVDALTSREVRSSIRGFSSAHSSKAVVGEVAVDVFEAVMPVQHDVAPVHTIYAKTDELGNVIELCLACWYVIWIDVTALKMREESFTWICVVRMRPKNHERQLELHSDGLELLGLVVWSAVRQDDRGLAP